MVMSRVANGVRREECHLCGKNSMIPALPGEPPPGSRCQECGEWCCPEHGPEEAEGPCLACSDPQLAAEMFPSWAAERAAGEAEYRYDPFEQKLNKSLKTI